MVVLGTFLRGAPNPVLPFLPTLDLSDAGTPSMSVPDEGVELTYLANSGFLIRSADGGVLIDGMLARPYSSYSAVPAEVRQQMLSGESPFDDVRLALVSHAHGDHFQAPWASEYLAAREDLVLGASPRVLGTLANIEGSAESLEDRLTEFDVEVGETETFEAVDGIPVKAFRLRHSGRPGHDLENLGQVVELGGIRVLHVGDAEGSAGNYQPYDLANGKIDVALVPYWYFLNPGQADFLAEHVNAGVYVAIHVPPKELTSVKALLEKTHPGVVVFEECLESRTVTSSSSADG